jgi:hypothetical protein
MKDISLTSERFTGEIIFRFNDQDELNGFEIFATLIPVQRTWLYKNIPFTYNELVTLTKAKDSTMRIAEIEPDLSFDRFWKEYNYKVGKKEAETAWKRLTKGDKVKAIQMISKYKKFVASKRIELAYPATYLNKERYLDEYRY